MSNILYVGPSWANRSYDTPMGEETDYTNLYKELNLDVDDLTKLGATNDFFLRMLDKNSHSNYNLPYSGIIWVYCEPISDIQDQKSLIESEDFWQIRSKKNKDTLQRINDIGVPIALIGAHSDIVDCDFSNITVIHPSWQKFLADYSNTKLNHGWGCEVGHRLLLGEFPKAKASKNIVNYISDTWGVWCKLDLNRVFCWCHPNKLGTELFAKEIKNNVQSWYNNL
jgi:hypothetical protein